MIAYEVYRTYGAPLTDAQRAARYRGKRHSDVTEESRERDGTESLSRDEPSSTKVFLEYYAELFEKQFGTKPRINYGKDGSLVKSLLRQFGEAKLRELLVRLFDSDDEFIRKSGHTIGVFASQINKLLVNGNQPPHKPKRKNPNHTPNCQCQTCEASR